MKRDVNRQFVILPLDKNAGKAALMCRRLYARTLLEQYGDTAQFTTIADCDTPAAARQHATQYIYQRAVSYGVAHHYRLGRLFAPPSSFVSMKNKSMESQGSIAMRILFSYYKHATKAFAKKVGRCLNLLITAGTQHLCTMEMQNMDDIIPWVKHVNSLAQHWTLPRPQGHRTHRYVKFFEVDVKQMFPRLRRGNPSYTIDTVHPCPPAKIGVWEAILLMVKWVAAETHTRLSARGLWFGIHDNKHMDVMRKAYGDQYENLSWDHIAPYIRFELFANDVFTLGTRVMQQLLGVAIGGVLSSQFATIYCMTREHMWAKSKNFRVPWSKTNTDTRPLGINAPPFRYRDNCGGLCAGNRSVTRIQQYFTRVLNLELLFEGAGQTWTVLMAHLSLHPSTSQISLSFKKKVNWQDPAEKRLVRYPDRHSPNARTVVQGFTPNNARNCVKYAIPPPLVSQNLAELIHEMCFKGYPSSWWAPTIRKVLLDPLLPAWAPHWQVTTDRRSLLLLLKPQGDPHNPPPGGLSWP